MKILVYKTAQGNICECVPVPKETIQKELSFMGKQAFIYRHQCAREYEEKNGNTVSAQVHTNRLTWLEKVKDFDNLTDEEFQDFIHCHTPTNHLYAYWIDQEKLPQDRTYRDAWIDVDQNGNVTIDEAEKANIDTYGRGYKKQMGSKND